MSLLEVDSVTGVTTSHGIKTNRIDRLTPSSVIHGDRKSPNPWNYEKVVRNYHLLKLDGMWKRYGSYGGAPGPYPSSTFSGPLPTELGMYAPPNRVDECVNVALGRFNEGVRGSLDLSVAMAESSQTRKMLASTGKFERYVNGIGGRRWANEWLQLQYGWLPLLSDVYGAANELIDYNRSRCVIRGRAKLVDQTLGIRPISDSFDWTGTGYFSYGGVKANYESFQVTKAQYVVEMKEPTDVQRQARWSSLNPASIAWELVPYSFVVDWFVDVGGFLRDTETMLLYNSSFSSGYRTTLRVIQVKESIDYLNTSSHFETRLMKIKSSGSFDYIKLDRIVLTSYPSPKPPRINTDLSWRRLLSAAALLTQILPTKEVTPKKKERRQTNQIQRWMRLLKRR
jgi:hypothetical protein